MKRKAPRCPECGSEKTVPILYGYPAPDAFESEKRGEVILGGCIVSKFSPKWHCNDCGNNWGSIEERFRE